MMRISGFQTVFHWGPTCDGMLWGEAEPTGFSSVFNLTGRLFPLMFCTGLYIKTPLTKEIGANNEAEACRVNMHVPHLHCHLKYVLIMYVKERTENQGWLYRASASSRLSQASWMEPKHAVERNKSSVVNQIPLPSFWGFILHLVFLKHARSLGISPSFPNSLLWDHIWYPSCRGPS